MLSNLIEAVQCRVIVYGVLILTPILLPAWAMMGWTKHVEMMAKTLRRFALNPLIVPVDR